VKIPVINSGNPGIIHLMINAYWEKLEFEIPRVPEPAGRDWRRLIDTQRKAPDDICLWDEAEIFREAFYPVQSRSLVMLVAPVEKYGNL
jgi:pullulanase/glycogen debranching enzyme